VGSGETWERIGGAVGVWLGWDGDTVGHGRLVTQRFTHWEPLADKVEKTRFEDGTEVVADFNGEKLTVNGRDIPCPAALARTGRR
jgi:hypothetical protein